MAKYINPVATGLAIGQGEAQVFDTSGVWKAKLGAIKEAKLEKEKKEKELLDSIVNIDTSKLWDRDLGMYNEKWEAYNNFVKDNYDKLKNPSKNVSVYQEKKRMEQEMLQFVGSSSAAAKHDIEIQKLMLNNPKLKDKLGEYGEWKNTAGNFSNPFDYISRQVDPMSKFLTDYSKQVPRDTDYSYEDTQGVTQYKKGTTKETWGESYGSYYDNTPEAQESANEAWMQAGGAEESGFSNPKDYFLAEADKLRPVMEKGTKREQDSKISFGAFGVPDNLNISSDVVETKTIKNQAKPDVVEEDDKRRLVFANKYGKEMPSMNVKLQGKVTNEKGVDVTEEYKDGLQGAKVESIVEISEGKYEVQYQVPTVKVDYQTQLLTSQNERMQHVEKEPYGKSWNGKNWKKWKAKLDEIDAKQTKLLALKKKQEDKGDRGYDIIRVPIDGITNIADLETNLGFEQGTLIPVIPDLLTKQAKPGDGKSTKPKFN